MIKDDASLDSILAYTDEAREFLTMGLTFSEDWDDDESTPNEDLTIHLGEYFDTPVQDDYLRISGGLGRKSMDIN